jgi:hypothetical protein
MKMIASSYFALLCCFLCLRSDGLAFSPPRIMRHLSVVPMTLSSNNQNDALSSVLSTTTNTAPLKCTSESQDMKTQQLQKSSSSSNNNNSRRSFLQNSLIFSGIIITSNPSTSKAVVMDASANRGTLKDLTMEEAEERYRAGRATVDYLLKNYDEICNGGGDNVRRYLGTVGTTSGLFGISKAMKTLAEKADDIVEYTELSREIEQCIEQADGSAYMAIFVTTSTSYTPPAKYFSDAKIEVKRLANAMDELAAMVGLSL